MFKAVTLFGKNLYTMKKYHLIALAIALSLHSCNNSEQVNPTPGLNQTERYPVSPQSSERLSDEERQKSMGRLATTFTPEELYINDGYLVRAIDYNSGNGYSYYNDNAPFTVMASTNGFIF